MGQARTKLKIGTRGSKLALWQSEWIKAQILRVHPDLRVELVRIKTTGDKILDSPLSKIGGKGLFVKEIEEALFSGRVDLAVHSMKDVPVELPEGLVLCCYPKREEPRDALVSRGDILLEDLPARAKVGTSSLRRSAQILHIRPDLRIHSLRGNVDTRLRKLDQGEYDAIVLAGAGLKRLGLSRRITQYLDPLQVLPAIGQGALGVEVREDDHWVVELLSFLNHKPTELAVRAERAFLRRLEGGCQVPIAAHSALEHGGLVLTGMVADLEGRKLIRDQETGKAERPEEIGLNLAEKLLSKGAEAILREIYGGHP